ncbi:MAG: hypothetical protein AAFW47_04765 [Pseudomonadota bacterium]
MAKRSSARQTGMPDTYLNPSSPGTPSDLDKMEDADALELRRETARYVERMTTDLCMMSTRVDLSFLAYLLDMARIEASDRSNDTELDETIHIS